MQFEMLHLNNPTAHKFHIAIANSLNSGLVKTLLFQFIEKSFIIVMDIAVMTVIMMIQLLRFARPNDYFEINFDKLLQHIFIQAVASLQVEGGFAW